MDFLASGIIADMDPMTGNPQEQGLPRPEEIAQEDQQQLQLQLQQQQQVRNIDLAQGFSASVE
jgi:hypothetical protein